MSKKRPLATHASGSLAPEHACSWCQGAGCKSCDDLGAIFSTVVLRGLPAMDGVKLVIEGYPPVWLEVQIAPDVVASFDRATQPEPPYWFIREDGNQVYHYGNKAKDRASRSLRICELSLHQSRLRQRWFKVRARSWSLTLTVEQRAKAVRILAKIDAAVPRIQAQIDALLQAN